MKKATTIAITLLATLAAPVVALTVVAQAGAAEDDAVVLKFRELGVEDNQISVELSEDGRTFVIDSIAVLGVDRDICVHPEDDPYRLVCKATAIDGFVMNAGGGDDKVVIGRSVPVPVTLRGGPGDDRLFGGEANDRLVGGAGDDVLVGREGDDRLYGGPDNDKLVGAAGDDVLRGGAGSDRQLPGGGDDRIVRRSPE